MAQDNEPNYIQQIFYALFRKALPNWSDVVEFSKREGINLNTLRDIYYKEGQAGIGTMNRVLKKLLNLSPKKVAAAIERVSALEPLSESAEIWNSIEANESEKKYYALVAKAVWEIDKKFSPKKSGKR